MNWLVALGIGAVPGVALIFVDKELGLFAFVCGLFVAAVTHAICGPGSNKSLKPTPLRGAA